ncbi:DISARM system phospholipase D-like protein DrmC [Microtetraspora malaysiensis]|uniref:DISARM system phospholipase D-like protein DrmC n=1 Tax=Microtetraspora malaysiensis TaxID=161358 RepID=UPI003D91FCD9
MACELALRLPRGDITALADAAVRGDAAVRNLRARSGSQVLQRACDQVLDCLVLISGEYMAGALAAASAGINRVTRNQHIDVVWTGPASTITTSRLTAPVVVSLIDEAMTEIMLVSYATHSEPAVTGALRNAAERGVEITLLLERGKDNPSYSGASAPFQGLPARRWSWPASRRESGASLHAKILVVDATTALVGSANITQRAMEANLECGLLIRGGPHPHAIRSHLVSLKSQGILA